MEGEEEEEEEVAAAESEAASVPGGFGKSRSSMDLLVSPKACDREGGGGWRIS